MTWHYNVTSSSVWWELKKGGCSKKVTFLSSPIASKHSTFPLTKFQPLKYLLSWTNLSQMRQLQRPLLWKCTWQPGHVYVTSFHPTHIDGKKKPCNWLCILYRVSKIFKGLLQAIWTKYLTQNDITKIQPEMLVTMLNFGPLWRQIISIDKKYPFFVVTFSFK